MKLTKMVLILLLLSSLKSNAEEDVLFNDLDNDIQIEVIDLHEEVQDEDIEIELEEDNEILQNNLKKIDSNGLMLKVGISSENVYKVKSFLYNMGYMDNLNNYYFDNKMKETIINYQIDHLLSPDGIIGVSTYEMINSDIELNKIYISAPQIILPPDVPIGDWIIINKTSNTLFHLNGGNVVNKYPIATGKTPSHTPEGKFSILTKFVNPYWGGAGRCTPVRGGAPNNPLGKRWMGLNINGGGWYGIHGNSDAGSIGRYITLGCIRMLNEDIESLYEIIDKGSSVWIGSETRLLEYGVSWSYQE